MKRILSVILIGALQSIVLWASPLTPQEALERLDRLPSTRSVSPVTLNHVATFSLPDGDPGVYVFDKGEGNGYLIVGGDDMSAPLLGYSDKGCFDEGSLPPSLKWWIGEYIRRIGYARDNGVGMYGKAVTRTDMSPVAPLVKTEWNQDAPYNGQTPEVDGKHCVTGCVATAMAQVMKHWNYPETGSGVGEATVTHKNGSIQTVRMLLNEEKFDWANMLDTYDAGATETEKSAVAYLMKACGYAVRMSYTSGESGAATLYVAESLAKNFGYNANVQYCQRDYYLAEEWAEMVYEELAAGRPVVYGGQGSSGGHCFVCDGYGGDGYFHFNWGWGGSSDGYFLLDALNPGNLGIGANGGGFNSGQEMVRGIQPTLGVAYLPYFVQQGSMEGRASGIVLKLSAGDDGGWFNLDTKSITIDLGTKIEPIAPTTGETLYSAIDQYTDQTLQIAYGWREIEIPMPRSLGDGKFRLTLCFRLSGTEEWTPVLCQPGTYNYIEFTKKGLKYTIEDIEAGTPEITGGSGIEISYDSVSGMLRVPENVCRLIILSLDGISYDKTSEAKSGLVDASMMPAGIYVVKAVGIDGTCKTLKILK